MKKITIAIDGHSSCGKSTMAKDLAREVGYIYVRTLRRGRSCQNQRTGGRDAKYPYLL